MAAPATVARPGGHRPQRGDIEGLRALAVLLVLVGHAAPGLLPGGFVGVDVFFVISGFLITGLLVSELERTGRISLRGFYTRRARRLLPAAAVVLTATLPLTYLLLPEIRWSETGRDVLASAGYVMNWRLAEQAVDYLAAEQAPGLLQHFWSLAVEEQFYLLWPLLLILAGRRWRRRPTTDDRPPAGHRPTDRRLLVMLALVGVPSLLWSIRLTATEPERAYFVTTTRLWELALGGVLAVLGHRLSRPTGPSRPTRRRAALLGWAGFATVLATAVLIDGSAPFPGALALLPTLGTVAILAAGTTAGAAGPARLLDRPAVRAVGAVSYPLYLWHWPLLVAAEARFGDLSAAAGLGVVLCSAVPAVLTHRLVEKPIRFTVTRPGTALRLAGALTAVPVAAGLLLHVAVRPPAAPTLDRSTLPAPGAPVDGLPAGPDGVVGAAVLGVPPRDDSAGAPVDRVATIVPDPLAARDDLPDSYRQGCITNTTQAELRTCEYGDPDAEQVVALAGDSHAAHWLPALQAVAVANRWRLVTYLKSSCPVQESTVAIYGRPYTSCTEWNRRLREALTGPARPGLLITSSMTQTPLGDGEPPTGAAALDARTAALRQTWSGYTGAGTPLAVIRDTPAPGRDVAECVSAHRTRLTRCSAPRAAALLGGVAQERAADGLAGVHLLDLNDAICPTDRCAPVIGGVLVYRDAHHLTATYARSLAPRLQAALGRLPD